MLNSFTRFGIHRVEIIAAAVHKEWAAAYVGDVLETVRRIASKSRMKAALWLIREICSFSCSLFKVGSLAIVGSTGCYGNSERSAFSVTAKFMLVTLILLCLPHSEEHTWPNSTEGLKQLGSAHPVSEMSFESGIADAGSGLNVRFTASSIGSASLPGRPDMRTVSTDTSGVITVYGFEQAGQTRIISAYETNESVERIHSGWLPHVSVSIGSKLATPPVWIEAVWRDDDGTVFLWYHRELQGLEVERGEYKQNNVEYSIGMMVSHDNGITLEDLGIILTTPATDHEKLHYSERGDFSVVADAQGQYLYFLYTHGQTNEQVSISRLERRYVGAPRGKVTKYFRGEWTEPGLGGRESPVLSHQATNVANDWAPSVHWNSQLKRYVILSSCRSGTDDGIHGIGVSFASDLSRPSEWSSPKQAISGTSSRPEVIELPRSGKSTGRQQVVLLENRVLAELSFEEVVI